MAACHLPSRNLTGTLTRPSFAAKSAYVTSVLTGSGLTAAVDSVTSLAQDVPEVGGGIVSDSYGGAVERVAPHATAFWHREALAGLQWSISWETGAPRAVIASGTSRLAATAHRLSPYASGAYVNYIDPTLANWQSAYYGGNLRRLIRVKRAVDPDDFFHFAQSVPTRIAQLYG